MKIQNLLNPGYSRSCLLRPPIRAMPAALHFTRSVLTYGKGTLRPHGLALYWNCLRSAGGDEPTALSKVRQKYFDMFLKTDLHFFLGTTQQFHFVAPNPWVIIGVFPIPHERQIGLL